MMDDTQFKIYTHYNFVLFFIHYVHVAVDKISSSLRSLCLNNSIQRKNEWKVNKTQNESTKERDGEPK